MNRFFFCAALRRTEFAPIEFYRHILSNSPENWKGYADKIRLAQTLFVEGQHKRKNGSFFPVEVLIKHIVVESKDYFVGSVRDVSDKKRLEEQYRQSQKMEAIGLL